MTTLLAVLREVAEECPVPASAASFDLRLQLSCERLPAASLSAMERVSSQVQRAPGTLPGGLMLVADGVVPTPHSRHPLARAARRTMRAVARRYRRLTRRMPDLLELLQQCAIDTPSGMSGGSRRERLHNAWGLAPEASRATRAAVDAVLARESLSVHRLANALGDGRGAEGNASSPTVAASRRNVLDRAFLRGEAMSRPDDPARPAAAEGG